MKLDQFVYSKLLRRPYHPTKRRFEADRQLTLSSARSVIAKVMDIIPMRSVVDVGCGTGQWLSVFAERGVETFTGIDGSYINRDRLAIDPTHFIQWDLNSPLSELALERFDLAMSLEVGEHLLPARAESLVDDLCALSDVVLYGAAIVSQAGENHINEQWQSYWAKKFLARGYLAYDVLRPMLWGDTNVAYWYSQNTIFYVKRNSISHNRFEQRFGPPSSSMLDVVHPELYLRNTNTKRGWRRLAKNLRSLMSQISGRRLSEPSINSTAV